MNLVMPFARSTTIVALLVFAIGCGSQTSRRQEEAEARAARLGHPEVKYTESLSPGTASTLGLLPFGAAGFYVGDSKLAATGFLWPFSLLWMPEKAYNRAVDANDRDFEARLMNALEGAAPP
jgi:hypothetical protein